MAYVKTPKFTDLHRYPNGWKKAVDTNVAETFQRAREEQAKAATQSTVRQLKRAK